jgi:hypothetical protein
MELIRLAKIVYGLIFILSAILIIFNVILSALYNTMLVNIFPSDLGYSIALLSIGAISLAYIKSNDITKLASSLLISTILAGVMFFLRLMVLISDCIDAYIIRLEGEIYVFNIYSELNYLEVYLAPLTFILLYYAYIVLRKRTI